MHFRFPIILFVLLIIATAYRLTQGLREPIARWDEQTNLSVVHEMLEKRSYFVPYYAGAPFFEKPPLWYTIHILISQHPAAILRTARTMGVFLTAGIIFLSVFSVWKLYGPVSGFITWIILLLSNPLFVRNSGGVFSTHTLVSADLDSLQILFILIAFLSGVWRHQYAQFTFGAATGLGILTKGPMALVPLVACSLLHRKTRTAWITTFIVVLPWYLFMILKFDGDFVQSHFWYHLVTRTTTAIEGHWGYPWYYLSLLLNLRIYPAIILMLCALFRLIKTKKTSFFVQYTGLASLLFFIIPSLVSTKLAWYILPLYPFLAILTGIILSDTYRQNNPK